MVQAGEWAVRAAERNLADARVRFAEYEEDTRRDVARAEKDLALRGPGELLGTRQTGLAQFRVADLGRDADLLPQVHELGEDLLRRSPELAERIVARWVGGAVRFAAA